MQVERYRKGSDRLKFSGSGVELGGEILGVVLWTWTAAAFDFFGFGFRTERRRCLRAADS